MRENVFNIYSHCRHGHVVLHTHTYSILYIETLGDTTEEEQRQEPRPERGNQRRSRGSVERMSRLNSFLSLAAQLQACPHRGPDDEKVRCGVCVVLLLCWSIGLTKKRWKCSE